MAWFDLVLGAVFGAWCGCYARIRCKVRVQRFGAVLGAVWVLSKG